MRLCTSWQNVCSKKYLHILCILTTMYGISEQASHAEQSSIMVTVSEFTRCAWNELSSHETHAESLSLLVSSCVHSIMSWRRLHQTGSATVSVHQGSGCLYIMWCCRDNYYLRRRGYDFIGVYLLAGKRKTTEPIFTKFGGKVAHGQRKKLQDFGDNLDHVTFGLGLQYSYDYSYSWV